MLVSVIIPVYKAEKYLVRCVNSVILQSYKNLEIILVDDGSPDNCPKICDDFASADNRISVIHKENGGVSEARNFALKLCKGDYITFLDSDDYFGEMAIEKMLELCTAKNAQISIISTEYVKCDVNEEKLGVQNEAVKVFTSQQALEESLYQNLFSCAFWGKMFRKDCLKGVEFPQGISIGEDLAIFHLALEKAKKVAYSSFVGHYYRRNPESLTQSRSKNQFNHKKMQALSSALEVESFCEKYHKSLIKASRVRVFNVAVHIFLEMPSDESLYKKQVVNEIRRNRLCVLINRKSRFREKMAGVLSFFGQKNLKFVWNSGFAVKKC